MDDGLAPLLPGASRHAFAVRRFVLAPGTAVAHRPSLWHDALVVVTRGQLDVESVCGRLERFPAGSVLWLTGLPITRLHNRAAVATVLVAVARRRNP